MSLLFQGSDTGASAQAEAVRAYLRRGGIERSWSAKDHRYLAEPEIDRWHNGREQGYVVTLRSQDYSRQLNIAFFEHRNSDEICAIRWEQKTLNPPTIDNAQFGDIYKDKYDVSKTVGYGRPADMADWIYTELEAFWLITAKPAEQVAS